MSLGVVLRAKQLPLLTTQMRGQGRRGTTNPGLGESGQCPAWNQPLLVGTHPGVSLQGKEMRREVFMVELLCRCPSRPPGPHFSDNQTGAQSSDITYWKQPSPWGEELWSKPRWASESPCGASRPEALCLPNGEGGQRTGPDRPSSRDPGPMVNVQLKDAPVSLAYLSAPCG